jgi:hypothetical protein
LVSVTDAHLHSQALGGCNANAYGGSAHFSHRRP